MNEENIVVDERIEKLRGIAKSLIKNYITDMYGEKAGIKEELERIERELSNIKIDVVNRKVGDPTDGYNVKGKGIIKLMFRDITNISDDEIFNTLGTLVHEFYHSVSKSIPLNAPFLEEGYVTYITAKTIRYSIEHLPDIDGITKEELREILKRQNLINAYRIPSEFVRSTDLIMGMHGYDSTYEYMFNEDGLKALAEVANKFSPELQKIIESQTSKKPTISPNLTSELMFFKPFFEKLDIDKLDKTSVEMNAYLQDFLISTEPFNQNKKVLAMLSELNPDLVKEREVMSEIRALPFDERRQKIKEYLPNSEFDWQLKENKGDVVNQILKLQKEYTRSNSKFTINKLVTSEFWGVSFCYDMLKKGNKYLDESIIKDYVGKVTYSDISERRATNCIKTYFERVKKEIANGMGLTEIINDVIADKVEFILEIDEIKSSANKENYMEVLTKIAEITKKFAHDRKNDFYEKSYSNIFDVAQNFFEEDKIYGAEDLELFRKKMQVIFDIAQMPEYIKDVGCTIDKMFVRGATSSAKESGKNFSKQMLALLETCANNELELGCESGDLDELCAKLCSTYKDISLSNSDDKAKFMDLFLHNFLGTDKFKATNTVIRRSGRTDEARNGYLSTLVDCILEDKDLYEKSITNADGVEVAILESVFQNSKKNIVSSLNYNPTFRKMVLTKILGKEEKECKAGLRRTIW